MLSISLLPFFPETALAGPDEITQPLMNDTVSMLDFGIFRLQNKIDVLEDLPLTYVGFDWERNLIVISGWINEGQRPASDFHSTCVDWFARVRMQAGVDPASGKLYEILSYSHFADLFSHFGFERTLSNKKPNELLAALDGKFFLELHWFGSRGLPSTGVGATCSGPMIDSGFSTKVDSGITGSP
jgi:hypothetical protein